MAAKGFIRRVGRGSFEKVLRAWRLPLFALLIVGALLAVSYWSWIQAQARAAVVLSSVLQAPVLSPMIGAVTAEPRFEEGSIAGNPALIARPAGEGPHPAIFFVNGTTPEGRELPEVRQLAEGLARAGYLVVVPDLPGLRSDEITAGTVSETVEAAREVSAMSDARGSTVGLVGVSTGATLALLAAQDPSLEGRVSAVAGVAPYADIRTVLAVATTDHYRDGEIYAPYDAEPFLSYVVARSLISTVPCDEDRDRLRSELDEVDRLAPDPLADLRARPLDDLGPEAKSIVELLANTDPERFDDLYDALPERVRGDLAKLSPLAGKNRIQAPVRLASGPEDKYFPVTESYALEGVAPDIQVTVTGALDHSEVGFSLRDLPGFLRLDGFAVRSLRAADAEPSDQGGSP